MLKKRPSRLFIPSFSFSSSGDSKKSSRVSRQASRRCSVRDLPVREEPPVPAAPLKPAASLEVVAGVEEPLFNDDFIHRQEEPERLPAPPSAALAAKWSEFLLGLSSPVSPAEASTDSYLDRPPPASDSDSDQLPAEDDGLDDDFMDFADQFEIDVATPTLLTSPGKPKMIDISPSASVRNSLRARSSSYDSSSSHYSNGSTASVSPPGTPLSSTYDSDHTGTHMPGAFPKEDQHAVKQPVQPSKRHCRDLTGSFIPTIDDEDVDDVCDDDNLSVYEDHITAVRQTVHRPLSTEITRVWFKA